VIDYAREITARTEQYWCPIKHVRLARSANELASNFVDYGDAEAYCKKLETLREQVSNLDG
jgi:hypothetical protein